MTTTPNGSRIVLKQADGTEHDVTEHVGALYDLVVGSMDYGSAFLTVEDAIPLARMVDLAGYEEVPADYTVPGSMYSRATTTRSNDLVAQARRQAAAREAA